MTPVANISLKRREKTVQEFLQKLNGLSINEAEMILDQTHDKLLNSPVDTTSKDVLDSAPQHKVVAISNILRELDGRPYAEVDRILHEVNEIIDSLKVAPPQAKTDEEIPDEETCQKWKRVLESTCPLGLLIELQKLAPYLKLDVSAKQA